ncbi:MAG TPA: MarR family transcriptional regulator [Roseiflexaceae bacterium]|nr:MarR family transcriptional regulator [Roseiflexaceae bacterium]
MQLFEDRSDSQIDSDICAVAILETVPLVMRTVRAEMRRRRPADLSVPQFRALGFVRRHPGTSLSDVAEHVGLTLSAVSTLIDHLVTRELIERAVNPDNRRRATLTLTPLGQSALEAAHAHTRARLAELLGSLSAEDRALITQAMRILRPVFAAGDAPEHDSTLR